MASRNEQEPTGATSPFPSDLMMKLLDGVARLDTRLGHIEEFIKDHKANVKETEIQLRNDQKEMEKVLKKESKDLELRIRILEASRNKTLGIAVVLSIAIPWSLRYLFTILAEASKATGG